MQSSKEISLPKDPGDAGFNKNPPAEASNEARTDGSELDAADEDSTARTTGTDRVEHSDNTAGQAEERNTETSSSGTHAVPWPVLLHVLKAEYEKTKDIGYLQYVIKLLKDAAAATSEDFKRAEILDDMGDMLQERYTRLQAPEDLGQAILCAAEAVSVSSDHPQSVYFLVKLASKVDERYQQFGGLDDLELAIELSENILAVLPLDHPDRAGRLANLANYLHGRYERSEALDDIERAIKLGEDLVAANPLIRQGEWEVTATPARPDPAVLLSNLSSYYHSRYSELGTMDDLERAVKGSEDILAATLPSHPNRAAFQINLAGYIYSRYKQSKALGDLEQAIKQSEDALSVTASGHPNQAILLRDLANYLYNRYEELGSLEDLDQAVKRGEDAVDATSLNHPNRVARRSTLARYIYSRHKRSGVLNDLEYAIQLAEAVVAATPINHPNRAARLHKLSVYLHRRYKQSRTPNQSDLDQAIKLCQDAVATTPLSDSDRAVRLVNLSSYLNDRYRLPGTPSLDDLEQIIKLGGDAVLATPLDYPDRASILHRQSVYLYTRYKRFGAPNLDDLEKAIGLCEDALKAIPLEHCDRVIILHDLGAYLHSRYEQLGTPNLGDLERAIKFGENEVAATPLDDPDRAVSLHNLATRLHHRYEQLGTPNLDDLEQAIKLCEDAATATSLGNPVRQVILCNLASYLISRFEQFGTLTDLEQAIKLNEDVVKATPPSNPSRATSLGGLAASLFLRYERLGTLDDLERAIEHCEDGIAVTPPGHPSRAAHLGNLASYFYGRYKRLRALEDLEQAIGRGKDALTATPLGHADRAYRLNNLATHFYSRYVRLESLDDLEHAIKLGEDAVAVAPSHLNQPLFLSNLASHFYGRYEQLGALGDLERAIELGRGAVAATRPDHNDRAVKLSNLASYFHSRYERLKALDDLNSAIKLSEDSLAITPSDHPNLAHRSNNLGRHLHTKYLQSNSPKDFDYTVHVYCRAWESRTSPPQHRIGAARRAGKLLATASRWQESNFLLEGAVNMLPEISLRFLQRDDQEYMLSAFSRLAAEAASIALQAGADASHCLGLLELGRGIIMGLSIDCRSDLPELQMESPDAFDKFDRLRTEIDSPLVRVKGESHEFTQDSCRRRLQAIGQMEETLAHIRQLPGFERFQLQPSPGDLIAMAGEGPIVIFNSTEYRSDAIIVTQSAIKALALPGLVYEDVIEWAELVLVRGKRSTYTIRNEKMEEYLLWLWDVAVEPVLKELQLDATVGSSNLTRIWWIGVGPLATAPFHAAGDYSPASKRNYHPGSMRNALDHVISSYIPTIKALSYARQKELELLSRADSCLLLVTMPTTPTKKPLKNSPQEAEEIAAAARGRTAPILNHPSTANVLEKLPSYNAIHFACHGVSNSKNPSDSHLLLLKDEAIDRLTVRAISNTNIKNAQLAYLSACHTANNSSFILADESIHIASGFQLAGFSHVLATLWESNDTACRQVAGTFYRMLFDGQGSQDHRKVSASFHFAVKELRDQNLTQPILWASFIHTGA